MTEFQLVSIVGLLGWLILAASAYRARQITTRKTLRFALIWASLFLAVAFVFTAMGG